MWKSIGIFPFIWHLLIGAALTQSQQIVSAKNSNGHMEISTLELIRATASTASPLSYIDKQRPSIKGLHSTLLKNTKDPTNGPKALDNTSGPQLVGNIKNTNNDTFDETFKHINSTDDFDAIFKEEPETIAEGSSIDTSTDSIIKDNEEDDIFKNINVEFVTFSKQLNLYEEIKTSTEQTIKEPETVVEIDEKVEEEPLVKFEEYVPDSEEIPSTNSSSLGQLETEKNEEDNKQLKPIEETEKNVEKIVLEKPLEESKNNKNLENSKLTEKKVKDPKEDKKHMPYFFKAILKKQSNFDKDDDLVYDENENKSKKNEKPITPSKIDSRNAWSILNENIEPEQNVNSPSLTTEIHQRILVYDEEDKKIEEVQTDVKEEDETSKKDEIQEKTDENKEIGELDKNEKEEQKYETKGVQHNYEVVYGETQSKEKHETSRKDKIGEENTTNETNKTEKAENIEIGELDEYENKDEKYEMKGVQHNYEVYEKNQSVEKYETNPKDKIGEENTTNETDETYPKIENNITTTSSKDNDEENKTDLSVKTTEQPVEKHTETIKNTDEILEKLEIIDTDTKPITISQTEFTTLAYNNKPDETKVSSIEAEVIEKAEITETDTKPIIVNQMESTTLTYNVKLDATKEMEAETKEIGSETTYKNTDDENYTEKIKNADESLEKAEITETDIKPITISQTEFTTLAYNIKPDETKEMEAEAEETGSETTYKNTENYIETIKDTDEILEKTEPIMINQMESTTLTYDIKPSGKTKEMEAEVLEKAEITETDTKPITISQTEFTTLAYNIKPDVTKEMEAENKEIGAETTNKNTDNYTETIKDTEKILEKTEPIKINQMESTTLTYNVKPDETKEMKAETTYKNTENYTDHDGKEIVGECEIEETTMEPVTKTTKDADKDDTSTSNIKKEEEIKTEISVIETRVGITISKSQTSLNNNTINPGDKAEEEGAKVNLQSLLNNFNNSKMDNISSSLKSQTAIKTLENAKHTLLETPDSKETFVKEDASETFREEIFVLEASTLDKTVKDNDSSEIFLAEENINPFESNKILLNSNVKENPVLVKSINWRVFPNDFTTFLPVVQKNEELKNLADGANDIPLVTGRLVGRNIELNVKVMERDSIFYLPEDAYIFSDDNYLNITWKSLRPPLNNSLIINLENNKTKINSLQLKLVKDKETLVYCKTLSNELHLYNAIDDKNLIKFDDEVAVELSNLLFLECKNCDNYEKKPILAKLFVQVGLGLAGIILLLGVTLYYIYFHKRESIELEISKANSLTA